MGVLPVAQQFADALLELKKKNDNVTDSAKKLRSEGSIEDWARSGALAIATLIDGARAVPTVFKMVGAFIAGTAGELVNFGKVANAVAYIPPTPQRQQQSRICRSERRHRPNGQKMIGEANVDRADGGDLHEGFFPARRRRTVCARGCHEGQVTAAEDRPQVSDDYSNATDRSKDQAKGSSHSGAGAAYGAVILNRKHPDRVPDRSGQDQVRHRGTRRPVRRVGGKDLADQITALQTQATDRFAENVQTRYTALVNALNAEAKRINAMPQDGERDRALEKYVKEYEKPGPLAKELAGIEASATRTLATRRTASASRSRKWKTGTRPSGVVSTTT